MMTRGFWAAVMLSVGCGGAALNPGAADVEWHTQRPDGDLETLGDVQCQRGGNFVGPATNVSTCRNAIRNEAHERGADMVVISSEQIGTGDCANCVVFFGTAYRYRSRRGAGQPTATATAGGSSSSIDERIHAGIEQRREAILQCTDGQPVTIVAAYAASGSLTFSLTGTHAGAPAESCVRSTLGQPTIDTGGSTGAVTHVVQPSW